MSLTLPHLAAMARRAVPGLMEGTIGPMVAFYAGYVAGGLVPGLVLAAAWSLGAVALRLARGRPMTGLLLLTLMALAVRTVTSLATGSVFVYFLQPTLGTFVTAAVFAGSVLVRRPLTERLATDLVDLPDAVTGHPEIARLHVALSLLWGATFAISGALGLWLLVSRPVGTFLLMRAATNGVLVAVAVAVSAAMFVQRVRRHDIGAPVAVAA